jgi:uncharacterized protein (DUF58 family)
VVDLVRRDFVDPAVLARLRGLPLCARVPVTGTVAGRHRSPHRGSSVEFSEYREYVPGDDPRRLDWRAYARSDRYYVKEFEAETNLRLRLVVDGSGSMAFGSGALARIDVARRIAAALGWLALAQGDAVGLSILEGGGVRDIPARRNAAHLAVILETLGEVRPRGGTRLAAGLHEVAESIPRRGVVVIISDLFVAPEELRDCFQHLRFRRHDVAVFQLLDPLEISFDLPSQMRFVDLEGGPPLTAEPPAIARRYREAFERHSAALRIAVREAAVDYHLVRLDEPFEAAVARFLVGRAPKGPGR